MTRVSHEVSCSSVLSANGREPDDRACQGAVNGNRRIPSPEWCSSPSRIAGGQAPPEAGVAQGHYTRARPGLNIWRSHSSHLPPCLPVSGWSRSLCFVGKRVRSPTKLSWRCSLVL